MQTWLGLSVSVNREVMLRFPPRVQASVTSRHSSFTWLCGGSHLRPLFLDTGKLLLSENRSSAENGNIFHVPGNAVLVARKFLVLVKRKRVKRDCVYALDN